MSSVIRQKKEKGGGPRVENKVVTKGMDLAGKMNMGKMHFLFWFMVNPSPIHMYVISNRAHTATWKRKSPSSNITG